MEHFPPELLTETIKDIIGTKKAIDWSFACKVLEPTDFQTLLENYRFDIINDFDEKNQDSFIHALKNEELLKYVHNLHFSPDFQQGRCQYLDFFEPTDFWYERCKRNGYEDFEFGRGDYNHGEFSSGRCLCNFEEIESAFNLAEKMCPNIKTIELVYKNSGESTAKDDICFSLFVERLQSLENLEKVDFIVIGHEGISKYDSILNRLPERLTSLNLILREPLEKDEELKQNTDPDINNAILQYLMQNHPLKMESLTSYSDKYIVALLNIETVHLEIGITNSGITPNYLMKKIPNVKNLTISREHVQQELVLTYEDLSDEFLVFLSNILVSNVKSICIINEELGVMMKSLIEKQKDNTIQKLILTYSSQHTRNYTSVSICKNTSSEKSENGDKNVVVYDVCLNETFLSHVGELLTVLDSYLDELHIDATETCYKPSLDFERRIYTNCSNIKNVKITLPKYCCTEPTAESSSQSNLTENILSENALNRPGACLNDILEPDVNIYTSNKRSSSTKNTTTGKQEYDDMHQFNTNYPQSNRSSSTSLLNSLCKKSKKKFNSFLSIVKKQDNKKRELVKASD